MRHEFDRVRKRGVPADVVSVAVGIDDGRDWIGRQCF